MKKILFLIGIIALAIISVVIACPISNDYAAKKTATKIAEIPLPQKTAYIERISLAGKLVGNGNGMQFFGAILIKSELDLEELTEYYKNYADNEWEYVVERQTSNEISIIELGQLSFKTAMNSNDYYIVYSWGDNDGFLGDFFTEFDIRGH